MFKNGHLQASSRTLVFAVYEKSQNGRGKNVFFPLRELYLQNIILIDGDLTMMYTG
jgi:hypothetical protein